ncbi:hypothetical protein SAMN05216428_101317 [Nitrosospira sp. Nsp11]|nr:hypothetical protein SAMN05216428_101317 [Nitrosospira sp. Nsp11]
MKKNFRANILKRLKRYARCQEGRSAASSGWLCCKFPHGRISLTVLPILQIPTKKLR